MDWKDIATVELPTAAQTADLLGVTDQLEQQVTAALAPKSADPAIPHLKSLAPVVHDAFEDLIATRDVLRAAEAQRNPSPDAAATDQQPVANRTADRSWRALEAFLAASALLEDDATPGQAEAASLHARLFSPPFGTQFTNYRPRRQWEHAQDLMVVLNEPASVDAIKGLGGTRFLQAVHAFHRDFGIAFGFTAATPVGPEAVTNTRNEQLALQGALREYLVKVTGQVSARRPETAVLAKFLLKPYADMAGDLARAPRAAAAKPTAPVETKPTTA